MKPETFAAANIVMGKGQPEYLELPAFRSDEGAVVAQWKLSWREIWHLIRWRRIWTCQLTFGAALQPIRLSVIRESAPEAVIVVDESKEPFSIGRVVQAPVNGQLGGFTLASGSVFVERWSIGGRKMIQEVLK